MISEDDLQRELDKAIQDRNTNLRCFLEAEERADDLQRRNDILEEQNLRLIRHLVDQGGRRTEQAQVDWAIWETEME